MRIGILTKGDEDPFVHQLCFWLAHFGHEYVIIYELDLYHNEELSIDLNSKGIGVCLKTKDNQTINFDEINMFFRRSWHNEILFVKDEIKVGVCLPYQSLVNIESPTFKDKHK